MADKKPARKRRTKPNTDTWKSAEREIAKRLDPMVDLSREDGEPLVERVPVTGRTMGSAPDIKHPWFGLEVKHGKSIPVFFTKAYKQAKAAVRKDQIPVVVFHPEGWRYDDCLVMVRLGDLPKLREYGRDGRQELPAPDEADRADPPEPAAGDEPPARQGPDPLRA